MFVFKFLKFQNILQGAILNTFDGTWFNQGKKISQGHLKRCLKISLEYPKVCIFQETIRKFALGVEIATCRFIHMRENYYLFHKPGLMKKY